MTPEDLEIEIAEAEAAAAKAKASVAQSAPVAPPEPVPGDEPGRKIGEPTARERRWGQIVSFMSGSPLFGTVSRAADSLTGRNSMATAQQASDQYSPKIPKAVPLLGGAPVLPIAGGMVATAPAGAARVGGTLGGLALNTPRASMAARVGLQGAIGGAQTADRGGDAGDIAIGTGAGLVGGGLGEAVGAGLTQVGQRAVGPLRDFASSQAVKAILGGGQIVNRVKNQLGVRSEPQLQALGREVLDAKLLGGPLGIPRTTVGINEANKAALQASGSVIGEGIETWDRLAAEEAKKALAAGQPSWTRPDTASAEDAFKRAATFEAQKTGTAPRALPDVLAEGSALSEPNVNTMRRLWDTKTQLGQQAFPANTPRLSERMKMMRAGQQAAARNIEQQLESRIGPDEMSSVRDAMKRYSLGKRIEGGVEDAATRDMAKSGPGMKDWQAAETMGLTGAPGFMAALASKFVRGRGNSALAMGADALGGVATPALGLAGGVSRFAVPAAARQSVADPLGPLREYLGLSPEERNEANTKAFEDSP